MKLKFLILIFIGLTSFSEITYAMIKIKFRDKTQDQVGEDDNQYQVFHKRFQCKLVSDDGSEKDRHKVSSIPTKSKHHTKS